MANRDRLHAGDTGLVTLFARTPQLCAAATAGLGSALWFNVVGSFAGLVAAWGSLVLANALAVAVVTALAMLVTAAGTLLAADLRADVASRRAWAEIDVAVGKFRLPAGRVAPPQIDPRYLTVTDGEPLRSAFDAYRFTALAPEVEPASCSPRIVVAPRGSIPPVRLQGPPTSSRRISTVAASDVALVDPTCQRAGIASLGHELLIVASCRALKQVSRAKRVIAPRLVANGGAWPEWLPRQTPSDGLIADNIVLSGDRGDRDRCQRVPGSCTGGSIVGSVEPPNCRGPPSVAGQRSASTGDATGEAVTRGYNPSTHC